MDSDDIIEDDWEHVAPEPSRLGVATSPCSRDSARVPDERNHGLDDARVSLNSNSDLAWSPPQAPDELPSSNDWSWLNESFDLQREVNERCDITHNSNATNALSFTAPADASWPNAPSIPASPAPSSTSSFGSINSVVSHPPRTEKKKKRVAKMNYSELIDASAQAAPSVGSVGYQQTSGQDRTTTPAKDSPDIRQPRHVASGHNNQDDHQPCAENSKLQHFNSQNPSHHRIDQEVGQSPRSATDAQQDVAGVMQSLSTLGASKGRYGIDKLPPLGNLFDG